MIDARTTQTSAGGQLRSAAVVVFSVLAPITTAQPHSPSSVHVSLVESTNAGSPMARAPSTSTGNAVAELRRLSGLTWEQLADLLQVSRRAVHFWATDKQMHPTNQERVHRMLAAIRRVDRGAPKANRTLLFAAQTDGVIPYDLLRVGEFEAAIERMGDGPGPRREPHSAPSSLAKDSRRPMPPADLLDALQDTIHVEKERVRRTRTIRRKRST